MTFLLFLLLWPLCGVVIGLLYWLYLGREKNLEVRDVVHFMLLGPLLSLIFFLGVTILVLNTIANVWVKIAHVPLLPKKNYRTSEDL